MNRQLVSFVRNPDKRQKTVEIARLRRIKVEKRQYPKKIQYRSGSIAYPLAFPREMQAKKAMKAFRSNGCAVSGSSR